MNIVEHIWSGTLELRDEANLPPLGNILNSLLAAPMICFTTKQGGPNVQPVVSYAADEVLPGASLADVLFEEFGIEICDRTIVLIEPAETGKAFVLSSQDLGQALGQVLVDLSKLSMGRAATGNGQVVTEVPAKAQQSEINSELMSLVQ
ncbi:hypothetical protein [Sulfitobacter geojensis]|uniref:hypothetical protein n=1 Tax=Sulfitobacter geojensis TaxID=1342299 RepID=UPI003B8BD69F